MGQTIPTLLINAEDLLVLSEWDNRYGSRYIRRPGLDKLLMYLSQCFEVILIYPTFDVMDGNLTQAIDRHGIVRGELKRPHLSHDRKRTFLDLDRIPRDPSHVIVMAKDPSFCKQVEPRGCVRCSGRTCWW